MLLYPALRSTDEPVSSLRLENLRDGIEDADLARLVVAQHGRAALLAILARERIFSIRHGRLLLGCTMGCDLVTGDEVRLAALSPRGGHRRRARARPHGAARGARAPPA